MIAPFAKEIELAEMLLHIVARSHRDAQKNAAARPPGLPCHLAMMSSGLHRASPYAWMAALAEMMPKRLVITLKNGITGSCHTWLPGFLLNLEKSEMLTARVE